MTQGMLAVAETPLECSMMFGRIITFATLA